VSAHLLPLTAVDRGAPFWPWTGWIYACVFFMPLLPCFIARTDDDVRRLCFSFAGMTTVCSAVFFLYPTAYPRPEMQAAGLAGWPLAVVRALDTARNCLPSQHVAAAFLSAFHIRRHRRGLAGAALALAVAISASTLTTKQHYLWDVLAGFLTAVLAYRLSGAGLFNATAVPPLRATVPGDY